MSAQAIGFPLLLRWSNPGPHGNNIYDLAYNPASGLAVQVGDSGQVYSSPELATWTPAVSITTNDLLCVRFWNGRALLAGANGTLLYADSLDSLHTATLKPGATSDWLEGLAVSPALAVAVGDNFAIYTSTDGATWQRQTTAYSNWLRGAVYANGTFVAVGETGTIATSRNGTNWSEHASGTTQDLNGVFFDGTNFLAVGNSGSVLKSANGTNWISVSIGSTNDLYGFAQDSDGNTLIVGDGDVRLYNPANQSWTSQVSTATDAAPIWTYYGALGLTNYFLVAGEAGLVAQAARNTGSSYTWSVLDDSFRNWLWDMTLLGGLYVAVGANGNILTSDSGLDWNLELVPESVTNSVFLGIGGTSNLLIAVGNQGSVILSTNAITNFTVTNIVGTNLVITNIQNTTYGTIWTDIPRPTTNDLQGIGTLGSLFVIGGDNGTIMTSPNGTTWTLRTTPTAEFISSLATFPGGMVAVGSTGTILTSPDAINWTSHSFDTTNWISRVRYLGGKLIAVGDNGTILTSTDGTHWTSSSVDTSEWLNDVTLISDTNQIWFVVGTGGVILASGDTVNWTNQISITDKSLYSVLFDGNRLVASGFEGSILRSLVVPFTNSVEILTYSLNATTGKFESVFQFQGLPDQRFTLDRIGDLGGTNTWNATGPFEIFNSDGSLYYLESYSLTNLPSRQFFRTTLTQ